MRTKAEILNHPVRMRIVGALSQGTQRTPQELSAALSDVPQATLYRHIRELHEGGLLEVVATRRTYGSLEHTYALKQRSARLTREEFAAMEPDEHRSCLALLQAAARDTLDRYVDNEQNYDPSRHGMTYFAVSLHLDDENARQLRCDLLELIDRYARQANPTGQPRHIQLSMIPETPR